MASTEARAAARVYTQGVLNLDMSTLETALTSAYGEAYTTGLLVAAQQTGIPLPDLGDGTPTDAAGWSSFWDKWTPGNAPAAELLRNGGLGELLDQTGATIKGIEGTTLDYLGTILADGVASGASVDAIARRMGDVLDDPGRAWRIADTETARAVSAASMDGYKAAGVAKVEWLVSPGACELCTGHAAGSPFLLADAPRQPAHPICRCSYSPVDDGTGLSSGDAIEGDVGDAGGSSVGGMNDLPGFGTTGEDTVSAFSEAESVSVDFSRMGSSELDREFQTAERERVALEAGKFNEKKMWNVSEGPGGRKGDYSLTHGYTSESSRALTNYTEMNNTDMNLLLRDPGSFIQSTGERAYADAGWAKTIDLQNKLVQELLEKNAINNDVTVARMMTGDFSQLKEGSYLADPGFLSTTTDLKAFMDIPSQAFKTGVDAGKDPWTFVIKADKGTHALPGAAHQNEIIFGPGSKQRILSVDLENRTVYTKIEAQAAKVEKAHFQTIEVTSEERLSPQMNKSFEAWAKDLSHDQKAAFTDYQRNSFDPLNKLLRSGADASEFWSSTGEPLINGLDSAISAGAAPQDMMVYRGMSGELVDAMKQGGTIVDQAYGSSSLDVNIAQGFSSGRGENVIGIELPKGTPMGWVEAATGSPGEAEVLLGRGGSYTYVGLNPETNLQTFRYIPKVAE